MVQSCSFPLCKNTTRCSTGLSFHRFPLECHQRELWKETCRINQNQTDVTYRRICGDHFYENDYKTHGSKKILKENAIPKAVQRHDEEVLSLSNLKNKIMQLERQNRNLNSQVYSMKKRIKMLLQQRRRLQSTKTEKRSTIFKNRETFCNKEKEMRSTSRKLVLENIKLNDFREKVKAIFTPTQIRVLETGQSRANWNSKDIAKCLALRCISKKAYEFVRSEWSFPLPSLTTLKETLNKFDVSTGPIEGVFRMLKQMFQHETTMNKQVIIAFDEMAISSTACYIEREDRIIGPHKHLQLICIRGIFSSFKIPIFMDFDCNITKDILDDLIDRLLEAGLHPRGIVHDLGGSNRGLTLNYLGITEDKPYYIHEKSKTKIWNYPDPAHLLKLLRNHFLDSGINLKLYVDKNKQILFKKNILEELIDLDKAELKSCFKLTDNHLMVENRERQNVRMACEVFSSTTASGIRKYSTSEYKNEIADFVQLVNDFWDIASARIETHPTYEMKSAYGHAHLLKKQDDTLNKFEAAIQRIKVGPRGRVLYPFQKGFLIFKRSLVGFWKEVKDEDFAPTYLITSNLGQCFLENVFAQIRGLGGFNMNPSPKECFYRIQGVMLSLLFRSLKSSNTDDSDMTTELSAELISFLKSDNSETPHPSVPYEAEPCPVEEISGENWSEHYTELTTEQQCELGGQEHVAGYIAKKFYKKFPRMKLPYIETQRNPKSWDQEISRGGLTIPSYDWINQFRTFEAIFSKYHNSEGRTNDYREGRGVMANLVDHLKNNYPDIAEEVIKFYVKTRTYIRIKHINMLNEQKTRRNSIWLRERVV